MPNPQSPGGHRLPCPGPDQGCGCRTQAGAPIWAGSVGLRLLDVFSLIPCPSVSVSYCHRSKLPPTLPVKQHIIIILGFWRSLKWVLWAKSRCWRDHVPFRGSGDPCSFQPLEVTSFLGSQLLPHPQSQKHAIFKSLSFSPLLHPHISFSDSPASLFPLEGPL